MLIYQFKFFQMTSAGFKMNLRYPNQKSIKNQTQLLCSVDVKFPPAKITTRVDYDTAIRHKKPRANIPFSHMLVTRCMCVKLISKFALLHGMHQIEAIFKFLL